MTIPPHYHLCQGSSLDRSRLLQFMRRTYRELYPEQNFDHLAKTIEAYFSSETPLWWVETQSKPEPEATSRSDLVAPPLTLTGGLINPQAPLCVGGLWMGTAIDQVSGDRHAHIFLLYIAPNHRRQGLGRALMQQAEAWALERGDRKISLQVFNHNAPALSLYQALGYQPQSMALVKSLH